MTLIEIETKMSNTVSERDATIRNHENFLDRTDKFIKELQRQREIIMNGLNQNYISTAEEILYVGGLRNNYYDSTVVRDAINDIVNNCVKIKNEYFGSKNYSGWTYQREDHKYGYGPKHGHIVFEIGLRNPKQELTEEEKECCLYYLNAIKNEDSRKAIIGS